MTGQEKTYLQQYGVKVASKLTGRTEKALRHEVSKYKITLPSSDEIATRVAELIQNA